MSKYTEYMKRVEMSEEEHRAMLEKLREASSEQPYAGESASEPLKQTSGKKRPRILKLASAAAAAVLLLVLGLGSLGGFGFLNRSKGEASYKENEAPMADRGDHVREEAEINCGGNVDESKSSYGEKAQRVPSEMSEGGRDPVQENAPAEAPVGPGSSEVTVDGDSWMERLEDGKRIALSADEAKKVALELAELKEKPVSAGVSEGLQPCAAKILFSIVLGKDSYQYTPDIILTKNGTLMELEPEVDRILKYFTDEYFGK